MTVRFHADDLGLHPAIDRAIFRAFEAGAIEGASILTTGQTFRQAARRARQLGLPLALHLAIVDTGPLSPAAEVPSLIGPDGRFPATYGPVVLRSLLARQSLDELRLEIGRQLQAFAEADLVGPTGLLLDGHQHLHILPAVIDTVLALGPPLGLTRVRLPLRSPSERSAINLRSLAFGVAELFGARARRRAARAGVGVVPCWGVTLAGHLTAPAARQVLASLPTTADGQLICHPGDDDRTLATYRPWGYAWETELATILELGPPLATRA